MLAYKSLHWNRIAAPMTFLLTVLLMLAVSFSITATAEDAENNEASPGHSSHGEAFNEGPRQAAYLMKGTGGPAFPVTTKSPEAQKYIDQGVGQLHGFWYYEAERSFRQAASLDHNCAMAYWGMAMANVNNEKRATGFMREANKRKQGITPREQLYLDILTNYYEAIEKENKKPEDKKDDKKAAITDPLAQEALAKLCESKDSSEPSEAQRQAEKRVKELEEKLKQQTTELEKKNAELKKKDDSVKQKEEEAKKKQQKKERFEARQRAWDKLVQEYPDDTHAAAFMVYQIWNDRSELPINSYSTADSLLDRIFKKEPNHPAHHYRIHLWDERRPANAVASAAQGGPAAPAIAHMWHMPGHTYSKLKRFQDAVYQQEASARVDHAYMQRDKVMPYQIHNYAHNNEWFIRNLRTVGRAEDALRISLNLWEIPRHPKMNKPEDASSAAGFGRDRMWETLTRFELWPELLQLAERGLLKATGSSDSDEIRYYRYVGVAQAATGYPPAAQESLVWLEQFKAGLKPADKKPDAEKKRSKSEQEDLTRRCEEAINHIQGAILLAEGKYADAVTHLKKVGNLPKDQLAWAYSLAGEHEEAIKKARDEVKSAEQSVLARAALVAVLWKKGDTKAAQAEFDTLRKLAATADFNLTALTRLKPLAEELKFPADWRLPVKPAKDIGQRPELASLGPMTWSPGVATHWNLPDHEGKNWSLTEKFNGKPVIVIFYLGYGCIHCVEQLNTFGPMAKDFAQAGIEIVAISTDTVDALHKSSELAKQEGGFPFPLLADPEKQVFQKYRCFDDFEKQALHGIFLIDAQGRIRWQEISAEPFTDAKFMLQESQRLLNLKSL